MTILTFGVGTGVPALRPAREYVPQFLVPAFDVVVNGEEELSGDDALAREELARLVAQGPGGSHAVSGGVRELPPTPEQAAQRNRLKLRRLRKHNPQAYAAMSYGGPALGRGYTATRSPWEGYASPRQLTAMVGQYEADEELRRLAAAGRVGEEEIVGDDDVGYDDFIMGLDAASSAAVAQQVFNTILQAQAPKIAAVVNAAGLNKPFWTRSDVDKVAVPLLQTVKASGQALTADDAALARGAAKAYQVQRGGAVEGWDVMGGDGDVMGDILGTIGNIMKAPLKAAAWLGNKGVDASIWATRQSLRPIKWAGQKIFGGSKGGAPQQMPPGMMPTGPVGMSPQQMAAYRQLAARKAAASQRILAAEAAQEAALAQQQQAMDLQDAALQAQDAEEAAAVAERIAMQAQAEQNLPGTPAALMAGELTLDSDLMSIKRDPISWRTEIGGWSLPFTKRRRVVEIKRVRRAR